MQQVACPGCGAPVKFKSFASVMAVCEFCNTTVLKDADTVKDLGKMSAVLEDYSPLQIGSSGRIGGRNFTLIGRIQLRYAAGMWNEWFALFDDGSSGWLGDSSGLFTFTTRLEYDAAQLPGFASLRVAQPIRIDNTRYLVAELRQAECIAGQGELPFKVGQGYTIQVADLRSGKEFLTLDYSDGNALVYKGQAVTLPQLEFQLLRDDDTIRESAAKMKGKVAALDCPACGGSITYAPGISKHLICPSCASQIDASSPQAQVLQKSEFVAQEYTSLQLGEIAKFNGADHQIIGLMKRTDDEGEVWTEYLLYNTRGGFLWLIETQSGWYRAKVQDEWPDWDLRERAKLGQVTYQLKFEYKSRVTFALGAFNWRVAVGDQVRVIEFEHSFNRLAAELTLEELTWSLSSPVPVDQINAWFGNKLISNVRQQSDDKIQVGNYIALLLALNAIPMLAGSGVAIMVVLFACLALFISAHIWNDQSPS